MEQSAEQRCRTQRSTASRQTYSEWLAEHRFKLSAAHRYIPTSQRNTAIEQSAEQRCWTQRSTATWPAEHRSDKRSGDPLDAHAHAYFLSHRFPNVSIDYQQHVVVQLLPCARESQSMQRACSYAASGFPLAGVLARIFAPMVSLNDAKRNLISLPSTRDDLPQAIAMVHHVVPLDSYAFPCCRDCLECV